jgi:hypothetical protein
MLIVYRGLPRDECDEILTSRRFFHTGFYTPYHYLRDRICGVPDLHRLADRIANQARDLALGASWPERAPRPAWQPVRVQSWQR